MTKNSSDQFSKQFLEEFLSPFGTIETSYEVAGETQWVDVLFLPTAQPIMHELRLLGRIAQTPCLIEPFRNQPSTDEIRSCFLKLFQVHGNYRRQARRDETSLSEEALPYLWILASSASENLLKSFGASAHSDWGEGIYLLPPAQRTAIVSINRLPVNADTLWLRLLGKGKTQQRAIAEVIDFNARDPRRSSILRLLANWKISIEITGQVAEEQELMMALSQAYLEWEQRTELRGEQRGITEGEQRGALKEAQSLILRQLTRRLGEVSSLMPQVQALSLAELESLGEALLDFANVGDLEGWLRSHS